MLRLINRSESVANARLSELAYVLWGTFLLFLTSQVSIPLEPVPICLATFGVMLVALTFDQKPAIKSILTYLGLGALGVPVFANFRAGIPVLLGTTGGYLLGYLVAVVVMTSLKKYLNNDKFLHIAFNCLVGSMIIFAFGIGWLARFVGFKEAVILGFLPFIIPGFLKAALLAVSVKYIKADRIRSLL